MSKENVEIVRRGIEAWNRRDLMRWLSLWSPAGEVDWSRSMGPLKGVYRSHNALETFWNEFWSTFEEVELETHGSRRPARTLWFPTPLICAGARGSK